MGASEVDSFSKGIQNFLQKWLKMKNTLAYYTHLLM